MNGFEVYGKKLKVSILTESLNRQLTHAMNNPGKSGGIG